MKPEIRIKCKKLTKFSSGNSRSHAAHMGHTLKGKSEDSLAFKGSKATNIKPSMWEAGCTIKHGP